MDQKEQDIPLNIALGQFIAELLPLLIPGMDQLLPFSPEELKTTLRQSVRREADAFFLFHLPTGGTIVHIEIQQKDQKNFTDRNLLYLALIRLRHQGKEVLQYVVYTGKKGPIHIGQPIKIALYRFTYETIWLTQIPFGKFTVLAVVVPHAFSAGPV